MSIDGGPVATKRMRRDSIWVDTVTFSQCRRIDVTNAKDKNCIRSMLNEYENGDENGIKKQM